MRLVRCALRIRQDRSRFSDDFAGDRFEHDWGVLALSQRFNDQGEVDEGDEHHIELFESREDASESPSGSEQPTGLELLVRLALMPAGSYHLATPH